MFRRPFDQRLLIITLFIFSVIVRFWIAPRTIYQDDLVSNASSFSQFGASGRHLYSFPRLGPCKLLK